MLETHLCMSDFRHFMACQSSLSYQQVCSPKRTAPFCATRTHKFGRMQTAYRSLYKDIQKYTKYISIWNPCGTHKAFRFFSNPKGRSAADAVEYYHHPPGTDSWPWTAWLSGQGSMAVGLLNCLCWLGLVNLLFCTKETPANVLKKDTDGRSEQVQFNMAKLDKSNESILLKRLRLAETSNFFTSPPPLPRHRWPFGRISSVGRRRPNSRER